MGVFDWFCNCFMILFFIFKKILLLVCVGVVSDVVVSYEVVLEELE